MNKLLALLRALGERSPRGRMARGFLANVYDKGVITLVQLFSIPVLTAHWGSGGFGVWLMLVTVPTYVAMSDLGVATAAGVDINRATAAGKYDEALNSFQSAWAFISGMVILVGLVGAGVIAWFWMTGYTVAGPFSTREVAVALMCIVGYGIVLIQMSILAVVYRATHKFAQATTYSGTLFLIEGIALVSLAAAGCGIAAAACAYFCIRLAGYLHFAWNLKRREPWVRIGLSSATKAKLRELMNPSLAALALTFSTGLALQGAILTLGLVAGPAVVATFGAARTLTRAPLQFSGLVLRPSLPELTRAIAAGNRPLTARFTKLNVRVALIATLPMAIILGIYGRSIVNYMSGGHLHPSTALMTLLAAAAVVSATWMSFAAPLIAINRQGVFAFWYLGFCALVPLTPFIVNGSPDVWVGAAMLMSEVATGVVVFLRSRSLWQRDWIGQTPSVRSEGAT